MATESFKLDLDNSEFVEGIKSSIEALQNLGSKAEGLENIAKYLESAGEVVGVMAVAFVAAKAAIDWTVEGEAVKQTTNQFELLGKQSGIATDTLKEGLVKAAGGLVSENDLLKLANKAMIEMGDNAVKLPQVMELARKATAAFGGDAATNFEAINQAIATGNTRTLKHMGIIIDANKAYRDYAGSIGATVETLSQSGKQAAIMEAVLAKGSEQFKNVNLEGQQTKDMLTSISVAAKEFGEVFVVAFEKTAGPAVRFFLDQVKQVADFAKYFVGAQHETDQLNSKLNDLQNTLITLRAKMADVDKNGVGFFNKLLGNTPESAKKYLADQIAQVEAGIKQINDRKVQLMKESQAKEAASGGGAESPDVKQNKVDLDKKLAQETQYAKEVEKVEQEIQSTKAKNEKSIEQVEQNVAEERLSFEEKSQQKVNEIEERYHQHKITRQQADFLIAQQNYLKEQQIDQMRADNTDREIAALQRLSQTSDSAAEQFSAGWKVNALKAQQTAQNFSNTASMAFQTVGSRASAMFKAIGSGSANAADAMKTFFLGALGDMATKQGEVFLMQGLGFAAVPGGQASSTVLIAEGAGLIALGGLLGAASSSSGGSAGASGAASPPGASTPDSGTPGGPQTPMPPALGTGGTGSQVTVQIQGNLFETDETKQRLMEMIREETDASGFAYKQIGV